MLFRSLWLVILVAALPQPALAERREQITFDLHLFGFRSGIVAISVAQDATRYAAAGLMESRGIAGALHPLRFEVRARGRVEQGRLVPERYEDVITENGTTVQSVMEYRNGVPQPRRYDPDKPAPEHGLAPQTQGGTVDALTAIVIALTDAPPESACQIDLDLFDGHSLSRLVVGNPRPDGEGVTCEGQLQRVSGYSEAEMRRHRSFSFTARFMPNGNGALHLAEMRTDSVLGNARLIRR